MVPFFFATKGNFNVHFLGDLGTEMEIPVGTT